MDLSLPTVTGNTTPGKSTVLRSGNIGRLSGYVPVLSSSKSLSAITDMISDPSSSPMKSPPSIILLSNVILSKCHHSLFSLPWHPINAKDMPHITHLNSETINGKNMVKLTFIFIIIN